MNWKKILTLLTAIMLVTGTVMSEAWGRPHERTGRYEISPFAGGYIFDGSQEIDNGVMYGGRLGYWFSQYWATELQFGNISTKTTRGNDFEYQIGSMDLLFHLGDDRALYLLYLAAGAGAARFYNKDWDAYATHLMLNYGMGMKYFFTDSLGLRADIRLPATKNDQGTGHHFMYTMGFSWLLGGGKKDAPSPVPLIPEPPKDSDWDGVIDSEDACADTPVNVAVNEAGCPFDLDNDGIPDYRDDCPDTPAEVVVTVEGCPVDTDGDGLTDFSETTVYFTDPAQADMDSDGLSDGQEILETGSNPGIMDSDNDRLTDGDEVEKYQTDPTRIDTDNGGISDGLEILVAGTDPLSRHDDSNKLMSLDFGITFASNSVEVPPGEYPEIAKAARLLEQYPELRLTLVGHTDDVGEEQNNRLLSIRRAISVMRFIREQYGIAFARMTPVGMGASAPLASNDNEEGRASNRRVTGILECCGKP